jgi:hypothetical protein
MAPAIDLHIGLLIVEVWGIEQSVCSRNLLKDLNRCSTTMMQRYNDE